MRKTSDYMQINTQHWHLFQLNIIMLYKLVISIEKYINKISIFDPQTFIKFRYNKMIIFDNIHYIFSVIKHSFMFLIRIKYYQR